MKVRNVTANLPISSIIPNPDNPRKDLGDLEELIESIKKNGVMQNLTVMPIEGQPDKYMLLIGHRRCEAARRAGVSLVPCRIAEDVSKEEQIGIMLEENMQRNDLTVYEQAESFQMMLDLGGTEQTIVDKTGFSRSTVRHRLNLAKLDKDLLKEKSEDKSFQLSLTDLYELEKIEDVESRNQVLKNATSSKDLIWRAHNAVTQAKKEKRIAEIIEQLEGASITVAPKGAENELWSGKWNTLARIGLDGEGAIKIPEDDRELFYIKRSYEIAIIARAENVKADDEEPTEEELEEERLEANSDKADQIMDDMDERGRQFVLEICEGKIEALKDEFGIIKECLAILKFSGAAFNKMTMAKVFTNEYYYSLKDEQKAAVNEKIEALSDVNVLLCLLWIYSCGGNIMNYNNHYVKDIADKYKAVYGIFEKYGWFFTEEEKELIDGSSSLYEVEAEE